MSIQKILNQKNIIIASLFFLQFASSYDNPFIYENNYFLINNIFSYNDYEPRLEKNKIDSYYLFGYSWMSRENFSYKPNRIMSLNWFIKIKNIEASIMPIFVNSAIKQAALGTNYDRNGISGRIEHSYIQYNKDIFSIKLGRGSSQILENPHHSIINSKRYPSFDKLSFKTKTKFWSFAFSFGQLGNEKMLDGSIVRRNISSHKFIFYINNKTRFEIGEMILYSGINRNFEYVYMNPFIPYFLNGLESERKDLIDDNDNSILYVNYKASFKKINYFIETIIDDYQIDNTGKKNALGMMIGFHNNMKNPFSWLVEYVNINRWAYLHHGNYTSWEQRGSSLGFPYGPDTKSINFQGNLKLKNSRFHFHLEYLEKGENNFFTSWGDGHSIINENISYYLFSRYSIFKKYKNFILEFGWKNFSFPSEISHPRGEMDSTKGNYYLGVIYIMEKMKVLKN